MKLIWCTGFQEIYAWLEEGGWGQSVMGIYALCYIWNLFGWMSGWPKDSVYWCSIDLFLIGGELAGYFGSKLAGDSASKLADDSGSKLAGDFGSKLEGDSASKLEGDSGSKLEGDFCSKLEGDSGSKLDLSSDIIIVTISVNLHTDLIPLTILHGLSLNTYVHQCLICHQWQFQMGEMRD